MALQGNWISHHQGAQNRTLSDLALFSLPPPADDTPLEDTMIDSARKAWQTFVLAWKCFTRIDGAQRAAAIAHYAFFSLFPLTILFVAIASVFVDRDRAAAQIIDFVQRFASTADRQHNYVFDTLAGVVKARKQAGAIAFLLLGWAAMRFFATLIRATNRAWDAEATEWWRQPVKSLVFLAVIVVAAPLSIIGAILIRMTKLGFAPMTDANSWFYAIATTVVPVLLLFLGLALFYKLAPRRHTRFSEVWSATLVATLLLFAAERLFGIYLNHFATLNMVYGAFGGVMALLLWIYLSGCIFVFGACLCAAQAEQRQLPRETTLMQQAIA